jgi:hypothetical protein
MYETLLTVIGAIITTYMSTIGLQKWKQKNVKKKIGHEYNNSVKEDAKISAKLDEILESYKASYARIYVRHNGEILANGKSFKKVSIMYERHSAGLLSTIGDTQGQPSSIYYSILEQLSEKGIYKCTDVSQTNDVVLKDLLQRQFVRSHYAFLMTSIEGIEFGFVTVSFCRENKELELGEIDHLQALADNLAGYLSGKPQIEK